MGRETIDGQLPQTWRVGTLAKATGLTVRALHHYDHVGLLKPSLRTAAGHRLYTADDLARLYRIRLLRRLGFPLEQITSALDDPAWQLASAVQQHLVYTRHRAAVAARLSTRLADMAVELEKQDRPSWEQLLRTIGEMTMLDESIRSTTGLLVYDDPRAAQEYLVRVYGLSAGPFTPNPDGSIGFVEVRAGDQVIGLHASGGDFKSPNSAGAVTGMTVIAVDDADAHHARSVDAGAVIVQEPVDQPYGVREYGAVDPEGQLWYFHSPIE
jgi:DNA-binding transcriptional MerR regulator/uncharacterized glyoxalase superfamily protein PhnB